MMLCCEELKIIERWTDPLEDHGLQRDGEAYLTICGFTMLSPGIGRARVEQDHHFDSLHEISPSEFSLSHVKLL